MEDEAARESILVELARRHPLYRVPAVPIAGCGCCDDVLLQLPGGQYALVHLSFPRKASDRPPFPSSEVFPDWRGARDYAEAHGELFAD